MSDEQPVPEIRHGEKPQWPWLEPLAEEDLAYLKSIEHITANLIPCEDAAKLANGCPNPDFYADEPPWDAESEIGMGGETCPDPTTSDEALMTRVEVRGTPECGKCGAVMVRRHFPGHGEVAVCPSWLNATCEALGPDAPASNWLDDQRKGATDR